MSPAGKRLALCQGVRGSKNVRDGIAPEEDEGKSNQVEHHYGSDPIGDFVRFAMVLVKPLPGVSRQGVDGEIHGMQQAEKSKAPTETVPDADEDHVHGQTQDQAGITEVARGHAQRREDIVGEPGGEGDVPAAPLALPARCRLRRCAGGAVKNGGGFRDSFAS